MTDNWGSNAEAYSFAGVGDYQLPFDKPIFPNFNKIAQDAANAHFQKVEDRLESLWITRENYNDYVFESQIKGEKQIYSVRKKSPVIGTYECFLPQLKIVPWK